MVKTPAIPTMRMQTVISGIGWCSGIASQVNFPNMCHLLQGSAAGQCRGWARADRCAVVMHDAVEHAWRDLAEGMGRIGAAGRRQLSVTDGVEVFRAGACRSEPLLVLVFRHGLHVETHVREAIAAELGRQPSVSAGVRG